MARTATEKRILDRRRAKGILVPILEEILDRPLSVEDDEDRAFMINLMSARARDREQGVFSPSMLSACERQAYFAMTNVEKHRPKSPRSNAYFLDGDFRHYKWQFALWKAHRAGLLNLLGVEVRVFHPSGDFAGTIDAIVEIDGEVFIVDFKGMHLRSFQDHEKWGTKIGYRIQIVGYAEIVNKACAFESFMGGLLGVEVKRCLLVGECKSGPVAHGSPIALHEDILEVKKERAKVKRRIYRLRGFASREETPPPDCQSTRTVQFQECPFSRLCREEVKAIEADAKRNPADAQVRRSQRRAGSRDRVRARASQEQE